MKMHNKVIKERHFIAMLLVKQMNGYTSIENMAQTA